MIELQNQTYTEEEIKGIKKYLEGWVHDSGIDLMENDCTMVPVHKVLKVLKSRLAEVERQIGK